MSYKTSNAEGPVDFINTYDLEAMAQQVIPKAAFGYIASGAEDTFTLRENIRAFNHKLIVPHTRVYLDSKVYIGEVNFKSGPLGLTGAYELSKSIEKLGIEMRKFKTGTPARIHQDSIDFSKMTLQEGDEKITPFSFINEGEYIGENQVD